MISYDTRHIRYVSKKFKDVLLDISVVLSLIKARPLLLFLELVPYCNFTVVNHHLACVQNAAKHQMKKVNVVNLKFINAVLEISWNVFLLPTQNYSIKLVVEID